jgi:hypothetical protein
MLADPASAALFADAPPAAMLTDPASSALSAVVPLAVVVAQDDPVTVPALCAAALGVSSAAAIVAAAGARISAAPAVEAAIEMPRQTVDQILLLPGLRQPKSGAQLLQLGDGLRARADKETRCSASWSRVKGQCGRSCVGSKNVAESATRLGPSTVQMKLSSGSSGSSRARDLGLQIRMLSLASCMES